MSSPNQPTEVVVVPTEVSPNTPPVSQYRTRSGRVTRQAVRYEPDPNTVFLDDEGDYDTDVDDQESVNADSDDESVQESEVDDDEMTDPDSDDDLISDTSSIGESEMESCDEEDVLDWDNLTDNASDNDLLDSEDEFEDDVVGMSGDEGNFEE